MYIFTPNTLIESAKINANFDELNNEDLLLGKIVNRQDITTNSIVSNQLIQYGWGYLQGNNTARVTEAVTFPVAYNSTPVVVLNYASANNAAPTVIGDLDGPAGANTSIVGSPDSITTTGFVAYIHRSDSTVLGTTAYYGYTWIAIGTKTR